MRIGLALTLPQGIVTLRNRFQKAAFSDSDNLNHFHLKVESSTTIIGAARIQLDELAIAMAPLLLQLK